MPLNSTSLTSLPPQELMERCVRRPWEAFVPAFPMAPGVWYISGNDWVACYLIDTGDGLILIDTAMHETVYLMLENIRNLGYKPTDIKKILLTHAHIDHVGGARTLKELTGASIYLGKRDMEYLDERPDLIAAGPQYTCGTFRPDAFYSDDEPIRQGNIVIDTISSPGHTPGCTSMFFDVTDQSGRVLRCGIHGGVGLNTLSREYFERENQPVSLRDEFVEGLRKLNELHVDICLPSHTNQVGILPLREQISSEFNPFVDSSIWHELMEERLQRTLNMIAQEEAQR